MRDNSHLLLPIKCTDKEGAEEFLWRLADPAIGEYHKILNHQPHQVQIGDPLVHLIQEKM